MQGIQQREKGRSKRHVPMEQRVIWFLASLICLITAGYYFWTTHDWVVFLILIGVATRSLGILEAIGLSRQKPEQASGKVEKEN